MYSAQQERAFVDLAWPPKLTRSASKGRVPKVVLLEQLYHLYVVVLEWFFNSAALAGAAG